MGRLALGAAGAVAGSFVGMPQLGFAIGSALGGYLFAPDVNTTSEGPRLADLKVTSSAYGQPIPIGWGTARTGGNMIWSSGIEEVRNKETVDAGGGKGGGSQTQTRVTYSYFASFAVDFGEGPADSVLRLWADGKVIYDRRVPPSLEERAEDNGLDLAEIRDQAEDQGKPFIALVAELLGRDQVPQQNQSVDGLRFRFYRGDETQLPDPLIEADVGEGNAPAHRGHCYIVIERLPLARFGNRIPQITAEIARSASDPERMEYADFPDSAAPLDGWQLDTMLPDFRRRRLYFEDATGPSDGSETGILAFDMDTLAFIGSGTYERIFGEQDSYNPMTVTSKGHIVAYKKSGDEFIATFNAYTFKESDSIPFDKFGAIIGGGPREKSTSPTAKIAGTMGNYEVCAYQNATSGTGAGFQLLQVHPLAICSDEIGEGGIDLTEEVGLYSSGVCLLGNTDGESADFWGVLADNTPDRDATFLIYKVTAKEIIKVNGVTGSVNSGVGGQWDLAFRAYKHNFFPDAGDDDRLVSIGYRWFSHMTGGIILSARLDPGPSYSGGTVAIAAFSDSGSPQWSLRLDELEFPVDLIDGAFSQFSNLRAGSLAVADKFGDVAVIDTVSGGVIYNTRYADSRLGNNRGCQIWDSTAGVVLFNASASSSPEHPDISGPFARIYVDRAVGADYPVSEIYRDLTRRVGLDPDTDIDVTQVGDFVKGYIQTRVSPVRTTIEDLNSLFFYDAVESDYQLKWKARGENTIQGTVEFTDLVEDSEGDNPYKITRTQEVEIPMRVSITYMDRDAAYSSRTLSAKRILNPAKAANSASEATSEIAVAMASAPIKASANIALSSLWQERTAISTAYSWRHLALDPADSVSIEMDDGTLQRYRLAEVTMGADLSTQMKAVLEDPDIYSQTARTSANLGQSDGETIEVIVPADFVPLKMNLLRDSDASRSGSIMYWAAQGLAQGFRAATLQRSPDREDFTSIESATSEARIGFALNTLGSTDRPYRVDRDNSLTVRFVRDEAKDFLENATFTQALNGRNAFALVMADGQVEIMGYLSFEENEDGSVTLSGLLRGMRGSEVHVGSHGPNEQVVLLNSAWVGALNVTRDQIDSVLYYRLVSDGQLPQEAFIEAEANPAYDLSPYAPAHLDAEETAGGGYEISWVRRARLNGDEDWVRSVASVPLDEPEELYDVEVLDTASGEVIRTWENVSDTQVEYTDTQITEDFGSAIAEFGVRVYQISGAVGRGYAAEGVFGEFPSYITYATVETLRADFVGTTQATQAQIEILRQE